MADGVFDLFGEPLVEPQGPGRPSFEATAEKRNKVMLLLACGWTNKRIAEVFDCDIKTLKKYFPVELASRRQALDRLEATKMSKAFEMAMDGSVPALKELSALVARQHVQLAAKKATTPPKTKPKKVQQHDDATSAFEQMSNDLGLDGLVGDTETVQ